MATRQEYYKLSKSYLLLAYWAVVFLTIWPFHPLQLINPFLSHTSILLVLDILWLIMALTGLASIVRAVLMILTMRLAGIGYMWVLWLFVRNLWIRVVWGWIISVPFSIFTILLTEIAIITKKVLLAIFFSFFWGTWRIWRIINMRLHTQILNLIIIYICSAKFNQFISLSLYSSWSMLNMKRNVWYIYEINQSKSFICTIVLHVGQFFLVCNQVERHSKWNRCRHANTFIFSCSLKFYIQTEHFYS